MVDERADMVEKRGEKWVVVAKSGRDMGEYDTEEEANRRLAQVEAFGALEEGEEVPAVDAAEEPRDDAEWSTAFVNMLPDSAFLYIAPGGEKDDEDKTVPRALRKFPVRGEGGEVDLPHLRNALARLPDSDIPAADKTRLANKARRMLEEARSMDSADLELVRRVDYLGEIHLDAQRLDGVLAKMTPEGFLRVDARLTRTGVFEYGDRDGNRWGELRTEDEVFSPEALQSFELTVLTDEHPTSFVDASNVRELQVGHVGSDVRRDGDYVRATVMVTDQATIDAIKAGKVELSCGYTAKVLKEDGVSEDGTPFAARQTMIRGNHVAIVDKGRAGPECRLLTDSGDAYTVIDRAPVAPEPTPETDIEPMEQDKTDEASALRARVDALEAELTATREGQAARIDARVNLITHAREILGSEYKTDGVSDGDIMRAVVVHVQPRLEGRLDANKGDQGYLRASFEQAVELHRERNDATAETTSAIFETMRREDDGDLDAEYRSYLDRITGRARKDH